jgi:copper homeostasis protein CutC
MGSRAGGFWYSASEVATMAANVQQLHRLVADGPVVGALFRYHPG